MAGLVGKKKKAQGSGPFRRSEPYTGGKQSFAGFIKQAAGIGSSWLDKKSPAPKLDLIAMGKKAGEAMDIAAKNKKRKGRNFNDFLTEQATNTETYTPKRGGNYG